LTSANTYNTKPEDKDRKDIDKLPGWIVQDRNEMNLSAGFGIAVREYRTNTTP